MKTPITHSQPDADGVYQIRAGKRLLGKAFKVNGTFYYQAGGRQTTIHSTMKAAKTQALEFLTEAERDGIDEENERIHLMTVDRAKRFAGLSHNEVRWFLDEIHIFHPDMPRNHYGSFMVRRTMENITDHPVLRKQFPFAFRWLAENPKAGWYRRVTNAEYEAQARLS